MAESEVEAIDQTNQLKASIETKCKGLPQQERAMTSQESLITFQDLDEFPLVVQQKEFEVQWRQTDALYFFTDGIPAYIIDEEVLYNGQVLWVLMCLRHLGAVTALLWQYTTL